MGRGWNKQELADAGRKTEDDEDFSILPELIGAEAFMDWRKQGDAINLKAKDHQRELGRWIVVGEEMKEIAGEAVDQRFKHSVYAAAADITGYSINTIKSFAHVARNVPEDIMDGLPTLGFAHFKLVAKYDSDRQLARLSEMLIGDLKVSQAREKMQFLDGVIKERKSKADRHASRIIAHLNHVLKELAADVDLRTATPKVQEAVLRKAKETRKALEDLTPSGEAAAA